jgi:hypothetical protein
MFSCCSNFGLFSIGDRITPVPHHFIQQYKKRDCRKMGKSGEERVSRLEGRRGAPEKWSDMDWEIEEIQIDRRERSKRRNDEVAN